MDEHKPLLPSVRPQKTDSEKLHFRQQKQRVTVEPIIILIFYCYLSLPALMEQYVSSRLADERNITITDENKCSENESDPIYQEQQKIQSISSTFYSTQIIVASSLSLLSVPFLTLLSDWYGRKPILLIITMSMTVGFTFWLSCVYFGLELQYFYISSVIFGTVGSISAFTAVIQTYYCDITLTKDLSFYLLLTEILACVSSILANLTTGFLVKFVDMIYPFIAATSSASCAVLYTLFFVHESLRPNMIQNPGNSQKSLSSVVQLYKKAIQVNFKDNGSGRRWKIQLASFIACTALATHSSILTIGPLYLMNTPLCFGSVAIGLFIIEVYVMRLIGSLSIPWILKRCLVSDTGFMLIGLFGDLCLFAMLGFLPSTIWIYIGRRLIDRFPKQSRC